jgi:two-component system, OmpR family, alkaline phosphatase synthesis response regulator PhoP
MNPPLVLIVETHSWIAGVAAQCGRELECSVAHRLLGASAIEFLVRNPAQIVVTVPTLHDMSGMALADRAHLAGGYLLLIQGRGADADAVIDALDGGADDVLTAPFNPRELRARMAALLRRSHMVREHPRYGVGALEVDPTRRSVLLDNQPVTLREREFDLLLELVSRPGSVVTRADLLRRVWGYDPPIADETLDVHVHRLRKKLGGSGQRNRYIETVTGIGYRFRDTCLPDGVSQAS